MQRASFAAALSLMFLFVAAAAWYLYSEHRLAGEFGFGLDDAWIHAVVARNLAAGQGYAFNPGEPAAVSSAPLYTAILALWYALFREVVLGAKLLGAVSLMLASYLFSRAAYALTQNRFAAWIVGALCVLSPALLFGSLSGMEIAPYLVSPAVAIYCYTQHRWRAMIVALAVGVWLRPEALLLLGLGFLAIPRARMLPAAALAALIVGPYVALHLALAGYPLPVTVRTKYHFGGGHFQTGILNELRLLLTSLNFAPLVAAVPFGLPVLWRKAWWAALFPLLFFLAFWANSSTLSALARYGFPLLPFLFLAIGMGVARAMEKFPHARPVVVMLAAVLVAGQAVTAFQRAEIHAGAVDNITKMQVDIARMARELTVPGDIVATNDIGAMGWFSGRYVWDLAGLAHPVEPLEPILSRAHPVLLSLFDAWYPERLQSPTFNGQYKFLAKVRLNRNIVCGQPEMSLYARTDRFPDYRSRLAQRRP